ncbi:hypothetical protein [Amycolatopsis thermoflava]|uniref:hypothetical protein n=1 Tax=Amycolatopsis thermoflava TaxID=84480 RepID=UPI00364BDF52
MLINPAEVVRDPLVHHVRERGGQARGGVLAVAQADDPAVVGVLRLRPDQRFDLGREVQFGAAALAAVHLGTRQAGQAAAGTGDDQQLVAARPVPKLPVVAGEVAEGQRPARPPRSSRAQSRRQSLQHGQPPRPDADDRQGQGPS